MTDADAIELVERYFAGEVTEDAADLHEMFSPTVVLTNAASPPDREPGALDRFLESFWDRTETRRFDLIETATDDKGNVFAFADAALRFREGAAFGPIVAKEAFTVALPVALRFHLDDNGLVDELDVFHETTTAARLAANPTGP